MSALKPMNEHIVIMDPQNSNLPSNCFCRTKDHQGNYLKVSGLLPYIISRVATVCVIF